MTARGRRRLLFASLISLAILPSCDDNDSLTEGSLALTCAASPASGTAPLQVGFTAVPTGKAGNLSVVVNFGDGVTAEGTTAGHTYTSPGSYTARFTAVGSSGATAECTTGVTVLAPPGVTAGPTGNQPPVAVFKTSPPELNGTISGRAPLDVTFNMCPSDDPDHDLLLFTMDANLDGTLEVRGTTGVDCRRSFRYPAGKTRARVCVTDVDGGGLGELHPPQCTVYTIDATP